MGVVGSALKLFQHFKAASFEGFMGSEFLVSSAWGFRI